MNLNNSQNEFKIASKFIAGGVNSPVRAFKSVGGVPIFIKEGKGAYLIDEDDNKYLDYVQSWGPLIFGHCDEDIQNAVIDSLKKGLSFGAPTSIETELASEILELFDNVDKIRFVSSGTEALMSAIRLARAFTNKDDIIKFEGCYHGHSDSLLVKAGSGLSTFGTASSLGVPKSFTKHTLLARYNDISSVKKCFESSDNIACIVIEAIAGNMGLIPAKEEFLEELRYLCDKHNTLLVFDEVMSGFRASLRGSMGFTKVKPDIINFGKVIGGGLPVGAFCSRAEIMDLLSPDGGVYQAGTLSGNPVVVSAGLIAIRKLKKDKDIFNRLSNKALRLMDAFSFFASKNNIKIQTNVRGSMFGFFFSDKPVYNFDDVIKVDTKKFAKFHRLSLEEGIYFACSAFESSFISSCMSEEDINFTIEAFKKVFAKL